MLLMIGVVAILDKRKNGVRFLVCFVHNADDEHDYNTECMNNTASLQGLVQQQQQCAGLKRRKQQEYQDSHSPKALTKSIPLLTSQPEMSWLNLWVESMPRCESRRSGAILFLMIGVVVILDKEKKCVRLCLVVLLMNK